jgi:uncharacterized membrane protein
MSVHVKGHPIHTILIVFPVGLYFFSLIFDIVYAVGGSPAWYTAAYYNLLFGVITTIPTAIFGFFDYSQIRDPRARRVATAHMISNMTAFMFLLVSLLLRSVVAGAGEAFWGPSYAFALSLSIIGVIVLSIGGWLGGELVYRHRVGVGIEPPDHDVRKPAMDEAGNRASDFPDFPQGRTV